jgi:Inorganic pyrophosphatase
MIRSSAVTSKNELPPHRLLVLKRFFQDYKQLEGKQVQVEDIRPAYAAVNVIEKSLGALQRTPRGAAGQGPPIIQKHYFGGFRSMLVFVATLGLVWAPRVLATFGANRRRSSGDRSWTE